MRRTHRAPPTALEHCGADRPEHIPAATPPRQQWRCTPRNSLASSREGVPLQLRCPVRTTPLTFWPFFVGAHHQRAFSVILFVTNRLPFPAERLQQVTIRSYHLVQSTDVS